MAIERYIGGGKLFLSLYNGTTYDAEVEVGEIQSATLKISNTYADAMGKDSGIGKKVDKVATGTEATISFSTQNVNASNVAMAMFGKQTTESFASGDTLPDGTVASEDITLAVTKGGELSKIEAKIRIVAKNVSGTTNPVLVVHHAVITPSGDVRDYFADKHAVVGFDGEILEVADGYFKEYSMPKA